MKKTNIIRIAFGSLYILGGIINLITTSLNVEIYRVWRDSALLSSYKWFIASVPTPLLTAVLVFVAIGQITVGLLILSRGRYVKLGILGAMAFHIVIIPWGLWNVPNMLFLIPLYILMKHDFDKPVIKLPMKKHDTSI